MKLPHQIQTKTKQSGFAPIFITIAVVIISTLFIAGYFLFKDSPFPPSFLVKLIQLPKKSQYKYTLAEFVQKQQTFSPYTKYEPVMTLDYKREKIYYVYRVMDDNGIWQIWTATSDFGANNWQEVQQTNTSEDKRRAVLVYNPKNDLIYYFYHIGSDLNAPKKIPSKLMMAMKKPDENKWHGLKQLGKDNAIDDTVVIALDDIRQRIIFVYTKQFQVTTAVLDLNNNSFKETVQTKTKVNSYIPHLAYDSSSDTAYIVFPRGRTPGVNKDKDLWLAKMWGDGSDYQETKLTNTDYENTWPFPFLDTARNKLYVRYSTFREATTYSEEGVAEYHERKTLGAADLNGQGWTILQEKDGMAIFGIDPNSGVLYGMYSPAYKEKSQGEEIDSFFAIFNPQTKELQTQLIPAWDKKTYGDARDAHYDPSTGRLFGAQQVCHWAGNRGLECQIWTYTGRVLHGEKSKLKPQTEVTVAPVQERPQTELKILNITATAGRIRINTNRKLSIPVEMKIISGVKEITFGPEVFELVDQDRGAQWEFPQSLSSYQADYKVCALSDPERPECAEGEIKYPK